MLRRALTIRRCPKCYANRCTGYLLSFMCNSQRELLNRLLMRMPATMYLLFLALIVCSCNKEPTTPTTSDPSIASANVNDSAWQIKCPRAAIIDSVLYVDLFEDDCGINSRRRILIAIKNPRVNSFTALDGQMELTVQQPTGPFSVSVKYNTSKSAGSGTVTIDQITSSRISGTYAVVAVEDGGSTSLVSNGEFSIHLSTTRTF